jgi:DNA polymerase-3 subunit chi
MGEVYFYHLTRRPLEAVLPDLLARALARGWRVMVRGTDPGRMDWLDRRLWLGPEDGFLPHGLAGGPHDARQPVLLSAVPLPVEGFACLIAVDGAEVAADEVARLERAAILFDGAVADRVEAARAQWRRLTAAGLPAAYWSEESGRWEKRADSPGR